MEKEFAKKIEELDFQHNETKDSLEKLKFCKVYSEIEYRNMSMRFGHVFKAGTGAETIREYLNVGETCLIFKTLDFEFLSFKKYLKKLYKQNFSFYDWYRNARKLSLY